MIHPSRIENDAELAFVSAEFWMKYHDRLDPRRSETDEAFNSLLYFQQGWQACKEFYKIND